jgi:hypothetical protein
MMHIFQLDSGCIALTGVSELESFDGFAQFRILLPQQG